MKYFLFPLLLLVNVSIARAKNDADTFYAVSQIQPALKLHAHAIIRQANVAVSILSLNKVKYRRAVAITILDSKGASFARLQCGYSLLKKIDHIAGNIYDENGHLVKEIKEKDVQDESTYGSGVFHSDTRIKKIEFGYYKYPFTVEYIIDETLNTTFFLPDWDVQPRIDCAVQHSSYTINYPQDIPVRFKEYLMPASLRKATTKDNEGNNVLSWNLDNISAQYEQPFSKAENYEGPTLVVSAEKFSLLDHEGSMDSWRDMGLFIYKLNEGLDALPEDKKAIVKSLTANETGTYNKIEKLYKYLQETTRYVAIEYGINGWQTFGAKDVAQNGYGDCKGLTNYLKALLKEAGIKSYATLVFAGDDDYFKLDESFPSNVFNHAILCVPDNKDTIWVECTSQQLAAGYLGDFTQDRKVLLTTENGGFICKTPTYNAANNFVSRVATLNLNPDITTQKINLKNLYAGPMQDDLSHFIKTASENKLSDMLNSKFPFATYTVDSYKYNPMGDYHMPEMEELADVTVSGICTRTQKRTFLNLGWMNNPMPLISQSEARTSPLVLNESYGITDSVIVNIPEGIEIESMPEAVQLSFAFGSYSTQFNKGKNQVIFIRKFIQKKGVFTVADYDNYLKMYNTVNAGKSNLNLVFLNKAS